MRLTMKPGVSEASTGVFFHAAINACDALITVGCVPLQGTTSTSGNTGAGLKKWKPITGGSRDLRDSSPHRPGANDTDRRTVERHRLSTRVPGSALFEKCLHALLVVAAQPSLALKILLEAHRRLEIESQRMIEAALGETEGARRHVP